MIVYANHITNKHHTKLDSNSAASLNNILQITMEILQMSVCMLMIYCCLGCFCSPVLLAAPKEIPVKQGGLSFPRDQWKNI